MIDHVKTRAKRTETSIPEEEDFVHSIVSEGGVLLALLVSFSELGGRSFPGRKLLCAADEPLEVHHIFPRAAIDRYPERDNEYLPDRLGNLTLLTRSDNEHLGYATPNEYLPQVAPEDRAAHLIPDDSGTWSMDKYKDFCEQREKLISLRVKEVLEKLGLN